MARHGIVGTTMALSLATALMVGGCAAMEKEEKVNLDQVPAAVKATLQKEAGTSPISTVDKEIDDGKTIYEADVVIDGKNYEIKVAEDGKLISKGLDEDEKK